MKHVNKIVTSIALFALAIPGLTYAGEIGVDTIEVIDSETLSVTLSENPNLAVGEIEGEITILNDLALRGAFAVEEDSFKVELLLETAIMPNTTYSLLSVSGVDGSIDFSTEDSIGGFIATNIAASEDQDIKNIEIIDDRTIIIEYTQELTSSIFEYKLLAESNIVAIQKPDYYSPELIISVEPPFVSEQDYILMFIDIQDVEGNSLEFDTGIYDFSTPILEDNPEIENIEDNMNMEEETFSDILDVIEIEEQPEEEMQVEDVNIEASEDLLQEDIDLQAAGEESSLEKDGLSEMDIVDAAGAVVETPDTGAQTWVLVLLTLVINSFYYLSRKKRKLLTA